MSNLYKRFGVTEEEVLEWGKKRYPMFLNAKNILLQLYLREVKKVPVDASLIAPLRGPRRKISELKTGEWAVIEVLVGLKIRENYYLGCPNCFSSVEGNLCPKCGAVEPVKHKFISYVVGDNTGDIIVVFPPRIADSLNSEDLIGKPLRIQGILRDDGEFMAQAFEEISISHLPEEVEKVEEVKEKEEVEEVVEEAPKEETKEIPALEVLKEAEEERKEEEKKEAEVEEIKVDARELELLKKVVSIFKEVSIDNLKKWHEKAGLKTPLEDLIKASGLKVENNIVRAE